MVSDDHLPYQPDHEKADALREPLLARRTIDVFQVLLNLPEAHDRTRDQLRKKTDIGEIFEELLGGFNAASRHVHHIRDRMKRIKTYANGKYEFQYRQRRRR